MNNNISKGRFAEQMAVEYLQGQGFDVLHLNWRHVHCEIDIIASRNKVLHFIEVKGRWGPAFGTPEEAVTEYKFRKLQRAASAYLHAYPKWKLVQFDIIAIQFSDGQHQVRFVEDIFYE